jgi:hypothetical protein
MIVIPLLLLCHIWVCSELDPAESVELVEVLLYLLQVLRVDIRQDHVVRQAMVVEVHNDIPEQFCFLLSEGVDIHLSLLTTSGEHLLLHLLVYLQVGQELAFIMDMAQFAVGPECSRLTPMSDFENRNLDLTTAKVTERPRSKFCSIWLEPHLLEYLLKLGLQKLCTTGATIKPELDLYGVVLDDDMGNIGLVNESPGFHAHTIANMLIDWRTHVKNQFLLPLLLVIFICYYFLRLRQFSLSLHALIGKRHRRPIHDLRVSMLIHRVHILFQLTFFLFLNPYQLLHF